MRRPRGSRPPEPAGLHHLDLTPAAVLRASDGTVKVQRGRHRSRAQGGRGPRLDPGLAHRRHRRRGPRVCRVDQPVAVAGHRAGPGAGPAAGQRRARAVRDRRRRARRPRRAVPADAQRRRGPADARATSPPRSRPGPPSRCGVSVARERPPRTPTAELDKTLALPVAELRRAEARRRRPLSSAVLRPPSPSPSPWRSRPARPWTSPRPRCPARRGSGRGLPAGDSRRRPVPARPVPARPPLAQLPREQQPWAPRSAPRVRPRVRLPVPRPTRSASSPRPPQTRRPSAGPPARPPRRAQSSVASASTTRCSPATSRSSRRCPCCRPRRPRRPPATSPSSCSRSSAASWSW